MQIILIRFLYKACIIANKLTSLKNIINIKIKLIINYLSELLSSTYYKLLFLDILLNNKQLLLFLNLIFVQE